jgi:hypothetical protein
VPIQHGTVTAKKTTQGEVSFFDAKRSWSVIKGRVLGNYMPPDLSKVRLLGHPIILVDCFAGEGKFGDDQPGSPLIMCKMAEKYGDGRCRCLFVNQDKAQHRKLEENLQPFIQKKLLSRYWETANRYCERLGGHRDILRFLCILTRSV